MSLIKAPSLSARVQDPEIFAIMNQPKIFCLKQEELTRPHSIDNYDLSLYLQRRRCGNVSQ
jgi:hypothetical protein